MHRLVIEALVLFLAAWPLATLAQPCQQDGDCPPELRCGAGGACVEAPPSHAAPPASSVVRPSPDSVAPMAPRAPAPPSRKPLKTSRGTIQLSGVVEVAAVVTAPLSASTSGSGQGTSGMYLGFEPTFGIFVANHFALQTSLSFTTGVGTAYSGYPMTMGAEFGVGVYPPLGSFGALYIRFLGGVAYTAATGTSSSSYSSVAATASLPFGVLIALNQHVGLDLGLRLNATVSVFHSSSSLVLDVPVGYFGVQSFF